MSAAISETMRSSRCCGRDRLGHDIDQALAAGGASWEPGRCSAAAREARPSRLPARLGLRGGHDAAALEPGQGHLRLLDQLGEDLARSADLARPCRRSGPAITEPFSTSPSITARRSAPAQKCSISSCRLLWSARPRRKRPITSRWVRAKRRVPALASARTGMTGKARVELHRGHGVARAARMKACLKLGCAIDSSAQTKRVPSWHAGRAHLEVGSDRLAAADPAGDEDRHLVQVRQDLLRQHAGRDRADMAAGLHALDHQRIGARSAPASSRAPAPGRSRPAWRRRRFSAWIAGARRDAAGEHDMADPRSRQTSTSSLQLRMHGDQVDAERPRR